MSLIGFDYARYSIGTKKNTIKENNIKIIRSAKIKIKKVIRNVEHSVGKTWLAEVS